MEAYAIEQTPTLHALGVTKLHRLGAALGFRPKSVATAVSLFDAMSASWADLSVGGAPQWPSDITDDGTPFEFSIAFSDAERELRMLVESQCLPSNPRSSWEAGMSMQERLETSGHASLQSFGKVAELFEPQHDTNARFSLWHAAVVTEGSAPLLKAYLNPQIRGSTEAPRLIREALTRLGLKSAWDFLERSADTSRGGDIRYFALDLEKSNRARAKVYMASSESGTTIDHLLRRVPNIAGSSLASWLPTLTGSLAALDSRPILTCLAFTGDNRFPTATVHVPIRCFVDDDEQALQRVASLLGRDSATRLTRALAAIRCRPLAAGRGLITYASVRPSSTGLRVAVYLAPEAYAVTPPRRALSRSGLLQ